MGRTSPTTARNTPALSPIPFVAAGLGTWRCSTPTKTTLRWGVTVLDNGTFTVMENPPSDSTLSGRWTLDATGFHAHIDPPLPITINVLSPALAGADGLGVTTATLAVTSPARSLTETLHVKRAGANEMSLWADDEGSGSPTVAWTCERQ